jgi:hypothetical protein
MGEGSVSYIIEENLVTEEIETTLRKNGFHVYPAHVLVNEETGKRTHMTRISYLPKGDREPLLRKLLPSAKLEALV